MPDIAAPIGQALAGSPEALALTVAGLVLIVTGLTWQVKGLRRDVNRVLDWLIAGARQPGSVLDRRTHVEPVDELKRATDRRDDTPAR